MNHHRAAVAARIVYSRCYEQLLEAAATSNKYSNRWCEIELKALSLKMI